jgi:general secretion pathway protein D
MTPFKIAQATPWVALLALLTQTLGLPVWAQTMAAPRVLRGDVQVMANPIPLEQQLALPNKTMRLSLNLHNVPLRDALRAIAQRAGFNVAVDGSVVRKVNLDLNNVTVEDALETLRVMGKLVYSSDKNTLFAADEASEKAQVYRQKQLAVIPLKYANPQLLANMLNQSVLAPPAQNAGSEGAGATGASGGANNATTPRTVASADPRSNSLIVLGDRSDIAAVRKMLPGLDVPRQYRTWRLSHANALNVSTLLSASLFNEGVPAILMGGGGSSGGGAGGANSLQPASVMVEAENLQEGNGSQQTSSGGGGGGGGAGGSTTTAGTMPNNVTIRDRVKESQTLQINPSGVLIVPDTRQNSITLFGTTEQIAMVDGLLKTFDKKAPQVVIEASLVEVNKQGIKELDSNVALSIKQFGYSRNNTRSNIFPTTSSPFGLPVGIPNSVTSAVENIGRFNTRPVVNTFEFAYQINALIREQKARIISHPTIITTHDSESVISIVDEIIRSVTVTLNTGGGGAGSQVSTQANIGEAGIVMSILPKIGANNTVSLRVRPTVSNVREVTQDVTGNRVTLLSKREMVTQNVTLDNGQSFVLGGLINETNRSIKSKVPGLSDLPVVGALMRSSQDEKNRSETLIIITPHILQDEDTPTLGSAQPSVPVNMPSGFTQLGVPPTATSVLLPAVPQKLPSLGLQQPGQ